MFDSEKLESIMLAKKVNAAELARRTGMSPQYISLMRSGGKPDPALSTVERIAKALGCPIAKLVSE